MAYQKATDLELTEDYLLTRARRTMAQGYPKPKWIEFCEKYLSSGYRVTLYEARKTYSKYVTVFSPNGQSFKVRFSNHKPIRSREVRGDCDFFVGVTHLGVTTTEEAMVETDKFLKRSRAKSVTVSDLTQRR